VFSCENPWESLLFERSKNLINENKKLKAKIVKLNQQKSDLRKIAYQRQNLSFEENGALGDTSVDSGLGEDDGIGSGRDTVDLGLKQPGMGKSESLIGVLGQSLANAAGLD
jgi:hypothetical protein